MSNKYNIKISQFKSTNDRVYDITLGYVEDMKSFEYGIDQVLDMIRRAYQEVETVEKDSHASTDADSGK